MVMKFGCRFYMLSYITIFLRIMHCKLRLAKTERDGGGAKVVQQESVLLVVARRIVVVRGRQLEVL
jgi:hypothetical protein